MLKHSRMPKAPTQVYACTKCGSQTSKWSGRCLECGQWGTLVEEAGGGAEVSSARPSSSHKAAKTTSFQSLDTATQAPRTQTLLPAVDRLLGGGLVQGSVTLLGGEPGIGKSTLLAQLSILLSHTKQTVLYVTGEESPIQVGLRLKRLTTEDLPACLEFLDETDAGTIAATIYEKKPALVIVDSIQSMRTAAAQGEAGNPTQLKASAALLNEAAKDSGTSLILVGQVTKDGDLAGPRLLEHLVDTVMMLEGDRYQTFRLLRVVKHRFGATEESALLTMTEKGLEEVTDPSAALIAHRPISVPGTVITCLTQGSRPLLLELQALVNPSGYGTPSRRATGIDTNRLSLLLAVLARHGNFRFSEQDVFVNAVGGVDIKEPSADLALILAIASAYRQIPIAPDVAAWGEVGLSGEIRPVPQATIRLKEAARLGFKTILIPGHQKTTAPEGVRVVSCTSIREAIDFLKLTHVGT